MTDAAGTAVALRAREDLIAVPQTYRGRRCWCVKDPVSLSYFHLSNEEYSLLRMLDGTATFASLQGYLARRSPGSSVAADQLRSFLGGLLRNGLVVSDLPGAGEGVWRRRIAARTRAIWNAAPKLLAMRFRGIDPSALLRTLDGTFRWIFSPWCLGPAAMLVVAAVILAATHFEELLAAIPDAGLFFTAPNVISLFVAIVGVKILHEFGHAMACCRLGGECHEMGVMLLVFAPCLYCDVSDSWLFPRRRDRIAVAAAGIGVELVLAALATFGWRFSEPGFFHAFCLNVMLVCSLNTLWLNGNPLLRYDGYFVLSDLLEIPNLATESRAAVVRLIFGREPGDPKLGDDREPLLLTYGILSGLYRVFLTWAVAWMVLKFLVPIGYAPVAYLFALVCVAGLAAGPFATVKSAVASPRRGRAVGVLSVLALTAIASALIPLPRSIEAVAMLQPRGAHRVYVSVGGTLTEAVSPGTKVASGATLGRLQDPVLEREVVELEGRLAELRARLRALESLRRDDATAAGRLASTRQAIEGTVAELAARRRDLAALSLTAPSAGAVLPPPHRPETAVPGEPSEWSGIPLDPKNIGCRLDPGSLFCFVGDPDQVEASLYVAEDDVEGLRPGQVVRLLLSQTAGDRLEGIVEAIAADPLRVVPTELARVDLLPVRTGADGVIRPVQTTYEVRVRLADDVDGKNLRIRGVGQAKIDAGSMTLAERFRRFLGRTFRFEL